MKRYQNKRLSLCYKNKPVNPTFILLSNSGKKPAAQKSCNVEVCTYDYPNGHNHFEDEREEKEIDDQGKKFNLKQVTIYACLQLLEFVVRE